MIGSSLCCWTTIGAIMVWSANCRPIISHSVKSSATDLLSRPLLRLAELFQSNAKRTAVEQRPLDSNLLPGLDPALDSVLDHALDHALDSALDHALDHALDPGLDPAQDPALESALDSGPGLDLSLDLTFVLLREALHRAVSERLAQQATTNRELMDQIGK